MARYSPAGYLIFQRGGTLLAFSPQTAIPNESVLVLVDHAGHETELPVPAASFHRPRFSPDGRRLAYSVGSGAASDDDIYLFDLADDRSQRLTFGQGHAAPIWSPDGKSLVFTQGRSGEIGLFTKRADGGTIAPLFASETAAEYAAAFSPDERYAAYTTTETGTDEVFVETYPPGRGKCPRRVVSRRSGRTMGVSCTSSLAMG